MNTAARQSQSLDIFPTSPAKFRKSRTAPSNKNQQFTPRWVADFARNVFGAAIALDPTSSPIANESIAAAKIYTIDDDALTQSWQAETLFFNPPYGAGLIGPMIAKFLEELPGIGQAIVLVNSSTCAKWYQELCRACDRMLLPSRRINFWTAEGCPDSESEREAYQTNPPGGNQYDQTLFYFGPNTRAFEQYGASIGVVSAPIFDPKVSKQIEGQDATPTDDPDAFDRKILESIEKLEAAIVDIGAAIDILRDQGVAAPGEMLAQEEKGGKVYHRVIRRGGSSAIGAGQVEGQRARLKRRSQSRRLSTLGDRLAGLKAALGELRS